MTDVETRSCNLALRCLCSHDHQLLMPVFSTACDEVQSNGAVLCTQHAAVDEKNDLQLQLTTD